MTTTTATLRTILALSVVASAVAVVAAETPDPLFNGKVRAQVKSGLVQLTAVVEVPPQAGSVVDAEWNAGDSAAFTPAGPFRPASRITLMAEHVFTKPGTYFPVVRVVSQRQGDASAAAFGRIQNLARVRVVVE